VGRITAQEYAKLDAYSDRTHQSYPREPCGILQTMTHGDRTMTMPTWPVRFDGIPTAVKSAPLLGEHAAEVLADWLGLDAAAVAGLRQDGIV
jgi:crotonobetainyl-CoA:carnitine CoA-transferase CaiB-like acyl-CoA transferase